MCRGAAAVSHSATCAHKAELKWKADIVGHQIVSYPRGNGLFRSEFVQYQIRVWEQKGTTIECKYVLHRFSEFRKLHKKLQRENRSPLPPVPCRFTLGVFEPTGHWFREMRRVDLQQYFDGLVKILPDASTSQALRDFLDVGEQKPTFAAVELASLQNGKKSEGEVISIHKNSNEPLLLSHLDEEANARPTVGDTVTILDNPDTRIFCRFSIVKESQIIRDDRSEYPFEVDGVSCWLQERDVRLVQPSMTDSLIVFL